MGAVMAATDTPSSLARHRLLLLLLLLLLHGAGERRAYGGGRQGRREGAREGGTERHAPSVCGDGDEGGGTHCMVVHVLFPHAMYFDIEDACHPRPASRGSAEALAAGPAAKEVGEEKSENGVIDTCGGREKKATAGGSRRKTFSGEKRARKV